MEIFVLIPAFNESKTIGEIVKEIRAQNYKVMVVDDGSSDSTGEIAYCNGATIIRNQKRKGKGYSIKRGLEFIKNENYEVVILMDGDLQHNPKDIHRFIETAVANNADIVIGSRLEIAKKMPFIRYLTNIIMSLLISFLCRQKINDSQCGFKLIRKEVIEKLSLISDNFEIDSEILIKAAKLGYKIVSLPIKSNYTNKMSYIRPVSDTVRFFNFIFAELIANG